MPSSMGETYEPDAAKQSSPVKPLLREAEKQQDHPPEASPIASYADTPLEIHDGLILDGLGRNVLLRGINLSGASKMPFKPYITTHTTEGFFDHRNVSFVGRPFPLEDADEHFGRLAAWGFMFLRFIVTWEAIEHKGPGEYDEEYFDYLVAVLRKAKEYRFKCLIDPHQDVWSRFTGGSGAPGWTLELAGFELENLAPSGACISQNTYPDVTAVPRMIWSTNYNKLAAATMFTLFFAGKTFAPKCLVDGENIQTYLQRHYFQSYVVLAERLKSEGDLLDNVVVGYDTLNEPACGYIGIAHCGKVPREWELKLGPTPSPFEGMLAGNGATVTVADCDFKWNGPGKVGSVTINESKVRAWREGKTCIWADHGVWDPETGKLLRPDYFARDPVSGDIIDDWTLTFWKPFVRDFTKALRGAHPSAIIFLDPPVNHRPPPFDWEGADSDIAGRFINAPHWYDGMTLIKKSFTSFFTLDYVGWKFGMYKTLLSSLSFGYNGIRKNFALQLSWIKKATTERLGDQIPTLIGEFGIPFDLNNRVAYITGDYKNHHLALDANLAAMESNLLHFTLWNYCPDNCHQWGDQWNDEDLSLYSKDDAGNDWEGARAGLAAIRPHAFLVSGTPTRVSYIPPPPRPAASIVASQTPSSSRPATRQSSVKSTTRTVSRQSTFRSASTATSAFELDFVAQPSKKDTVIYVPLRGPWADRGCVRVMVEPADAANGWRWDGVHLVLEVDGGEQGGVEVHVRLEAGGNVGSNTKVEPSNTKVEPIEEVSR
ncbi:glycoside hydrolase superfamily [Fimicolochytrium jonesii]|uniref:glycoside hydrolase superfamily n=1 Tax=Fimicolochytrium jonesii TaxID=1396493 RepID=UPI0022FE3CBE|nr:glycoside hydrolase superfamily [Fimicolochytrium jonesii]KAI8825891.1 glycoside hydrolase superfamily [Fimicolochytrium jonesii]